MLVDTLNSEYQTVNEKWGGDGDELSKDVLADAVVDLSIEEAYVWGQETRFAVT